VTNDKNLDCLINTLYETALDSSHWQEAVRLCGKYLGGVEAHLLTLDKKTNSPTHDVFSGVSLSQDSVDRYIQHFYYIDPRKTMITEGAVNDWQCCHHFFSQKFFDHNEFFQDFSLYHGIRYTMIGAIDDNPHDRTTLQILRAVGQPHFDEAEQLAAQHLNGHIQRALRLQKQTLNLQTKAELGAMAIDALALAMFIVNGSGKILHLNISAENLLNSSVSGLSSKAGCLVASHHTDKNQFLGLIMAATTYPAVGGAMFLKNSDAKQVFITPLPAASKFNQDWQIPLALVLITERGKSLPQLQFLKQLYDLSPAELRVAVALLEGKSLENYALMAGVTMNTVRTQLKHLFTKTGTHRQSELVAILSRIPQYKNSV
jgi:DNA-binding CsgD family transcriptional regulator